MVTGVIPLAKPSRDNETRRVSRSAKPPEDVPEDAPSTADEQALARALQRSLVALILLGLLAGSVIWWLTRSPAPVADRLTTLTEPRLPPRNNQRIPKVIFTDITASSGVDFVHYNGARGEKLLPETMGAGVAAFDVDGDGDIDLLFLNGTHWPGDGATQRPGPGDRGPVLYRNDTRPGGPIHFTDVTAGAGLGGSFYGTGVACGDFDGDGRVDLYLTGVGGNRLLRNEGTDNQGQPRFRDVTGQSGVGGTGTEWSTAAAWVDIDNDGDLDLYVGNYVGWTPELDREVNNQLTGVGRAYGRPWNFPGSLPHLYRNDGPVKPGDPGAGTRFTEISGASGLQQRNPATGLPMAKTLAVGPVDLNGDGWIDLVVANDTVQNFVFTNRHDGTFREVGAVLGIAFDSFGQARGAMGLDTARFREDDPALGIAIGNFANEMNALYVASGRRDELVFADEAIAQGLGPASQLYLKFGLFFFDYDLDGRLDVLTANGHIEEDVSKVQEGVSYRQPAQLFWNAGGQGGGGTFVSVGTNQAGPDLFQPLVGRGSAYADLDGDGDLDVVLTQVNGPPLVLRNDQQLGHAWFRLKLVGTRSNRDAIGAWITVRSGVRTLQRQVMPTKSYLSQSELPVTVGLGPGGKVDEVVITWPGGKRQRLGTVPLGRETVIREE